VRRRKPPSQTWRTFLENHVKTMVSVDFFTVPTIRFQIGSPGAVFKTRRDHSHQIRVKQLRQAEHLCLLKGLCQTFNLA